MNEIWNPWHGCHKISAGCKHCYMFRGDELWLCFTSDLLIEEADEWRPEIWKMIRMRSDCSFTFLTKRPERLTDCLPDDWGDGYENITIGCTVENQDRADYRMPIFLSVPILHRIVMAEPMLGPIEMSRFLTTGLIEGYDLIVEHLSKQKKEELNNK